MPLTWNVRLFGVLAMCIAFSGACAGGQSPQSPQGATRAGTANPAEPTAEDKRKALEADTERLVQLARQLRDELEHTRQDELSMKVLRDADAIDKLARSARSRIH